MSDPNVGTAAFSPEVVESGFEQPRPVVASSLAKDAWRTLRRRPTFIFASILIVVFLLMSITPQLFTFQDPNDCNIEFSRGLPSAAAWFGYDLQGCDIYTRTVYGARASILVGIATVAITVLIGAAIGVLAGFYGKWVDALLSRVTDVFFAIPLLLGGILVLSSFPATDSPSEFTEVGKVVLGLSIFGWTALARIMRSSVIQVRSSDYVEAARSLGASNWRIIRYHVLPNALGPTIVLATLLLGGFIGAEATLSFLGLGLQPPAISWGIQISEAQPYVRVAPHLLFFPAFFLSMAVLSFIMLGDVVRDALDPKAAR